MKRFQLSALTAALAAAFLLSTLACVKKEEGAPACKTCKAIGTSITEKRVCSEAEEQSFRNEHAGKEISCR